MFGGTDGLTYFNVFDRDFDGNFALGASSSDRGIVNSSDLPNTVLVFLNNDGTQRWNQALDVLYELISSIKFSPDGSRLVFITDFFDKQVKMVILNPLTSYQVISSFLILDQTGADIVRVVQESLLYDGQYVYIGTQTYLTTGGAYFKLIKVNISGALIWEYTLIKSGGQVIVLNFGFSADLFVGGNDEPQALTIARILVNQATTRAYDIWNMKYYQPATPYYTIKEQAIKNGNPSKLAYCLDNLGTPVAPLTFIDINLNSQYDVSSIQSFIFTEPSEQLRCRGIFIKDDNTIFSIIYLINSQLCKFAKIVISDQTIQFQTLPIEDGVVYNSLFVNEFKSYYIGYVDTIKDFTPTKSFIQRSAFLMSYDIAESCLSFQYKMSDILHLGTIKFDFIQGLGVNKAPEIMRFQAQTLSIYTAGPNLITTPWCVDQRIISIPNFNDQIYFITDPTLVFTVPNFILDVPCTDLSWTLTFQYLVSGNPSIQPSFITNTQFTYSVFTNNPNDIGTYTFRITGQLPNQQVASRYFNVIIKLDCAKVTITTGPILSPQNYDIASGIPKTLGNVNSWTQNILNPFCPNLQYQIEEQITGQLANPIFYMIGSNIIVMATDYIHLGTYNLNLVGIVGAYTQKKLPFQINIINSCSSISITSVTVADILYYTTTAQQQKIISPFTQNGPVLCNQFTYKISYVNEIPIDPSIFSFDSSTLTFSVQTSNPIKVGIYQILVTGYVIDPNVKSSITFKVQIKDNCENVVITKSSDRFLTYTVKDPPILLNSFVFNENLGICGAFTYQCLTNTGAFINTEIFTFNSLVPTLEIKTSNVLHAGTYNLVLKANLNNWKQSQILITVTIILGCIDSTITPWTIPTQFYEVNTSPITFSFNQWTSSISGCGSFTYTVTEQDGSALDTNYIQYTSLSRTFTVQTSNTNYIGERTIKIYGKLGTYNTFEYQFKVVITCFINQITSSFTMTNYEYTINQPELIILSPQFTQSPNCGYKIQKQARYLDDQNREQQLPNFIYFDGSQFKVFTTQNSDSGNYFIRVKVWLNDSKGKVQNSFTWKLMVIGTSYYYFDESHQNPMFKYPLVDQFLKPKEIRIYYLPPIITFDNKKCKITVNDLEISSFSKFQNNNFLFTPEEKNLGIYTVGVQLSEIKNSFNFNEYQFKVIVEENQHSLDQKPVQYFNVSEDLKAQIKSIENNGIITIQFNRKIILTELVNSTNVLIQIEEVEGQKPIEFDWRFQSLEENELKIQLEFKDPIMISSLQVRNCSLHLQELNYLSIEFLADSLILDKATRNRWNITKLNAVEVPSQITIQGKMYIKNFTRLQNSKNPIQINCFSI